MNPNLVSFQKYILFETVLNIGCSIPPLVRPFCGLRCLYGIAQVTIAVSQLAYACLKTSQTHENWKRAKKFKVKHGVGNFIRGCGEYWLNHWVPYTCLIIGGMQLSRSHYMCKIRTLPFTRWNIGIGFTPVYSYNVSGV